MKKLILLGALIAPFFVSSQTIFDNVQNQPKFDKSTESWKLGGYSRNPDNYTLSYGGLCAEALPNDTGYPNFRHNYGCELTLNEAGDYASGTYQYDSYTENPDGSTKNVSNGNVVYISGYRMLKPVSVCGEDANGLTAFTFESNGLCYTPQSLEDSDSCSLDSGDILPRSGSTEDVCRIKADGSQCLYESVTTDEGVAFFTPKAEPSSCYVDPIPNQYVDVISPPTDNNCTFVEGSTHLCPEAKELKTSSTGNVDTGCGTFSFDGSPDTFVCFVKDADLNGVISEEERTTTSTDPTEPTNPTEPTDPSDPNNVQNFNLLTSINSSVQGVSSSVDGVKTSVDGVKTSVDGLKSSVDGVKNSVEGLRSDLSPDGVSGLSGEPSAGLTGFYTPVYANGFQGVWEDKQVLFAQTPVMTWIESWRITVGGSYYFPEFCANFIHNFGCHSFNIDERAFPFIRIILIITALMYARRLVTGG